LPLTSTMHGSRARSKGTPRSQPPERLGSNLANWNGLTSNPAPTNGYATVIQTLNGRPPPSRRGSRSTMARRRWRARRRIGARRDIPISDETQNAARRTKPGWLTDNGQPTTCPSTPRERGRPCGRRLARLLWSRGLRGRPRQRRPNSASANDTNHPQRVARAASLAAGEGARVHALRLFLLRPAGHGRSAGRCPACRRRASRSSVTVHFLRRRRAAFVRRRLQWTNAGEARRPPSQSIRSRCRARSSRLRTGIASPPSRTSRGAVVVAVGFAHPPAPAAARHASATSDRSPSPNSFRI